MISCANAYGKDKLSFNDRIKWVQDNKYAILSIDTEFIKKADEPITFLNLALTQREWYTDPNTPLGNMFRFTTYKGSSLSLWLMKSQEKQ